MQPSYQKLYALLTVKFFNPSGPPSPPAPSAVEIVDLTNMKLLRFFSIGDRDVTSLAVSQDERSLYVTDLTNQACTVFDGSTGVEIASVPITDEPRDCVLSEDNWTLYVTGSHSITAIDTATHTVKWSLETGDDLMNGIALSPDSSTLAAAGIPADASNPAALYLVRVDSTPATHQRISIIGNVTGCPPSPNDVAFTNTGRVLLWDSSCDSLYQVDVASATQLVADTINLVRDGGGSGNFNNALLYDPTNAHAYAIKESVDDTPNNQGFAILDPALLSSKLVDGFTGIPYVPCLTPDGQSLFFSVIHPSTPGGANTLDKYDTVNDTFTRDIYAFFVGWMSVRDMHIWSFVP
jgi:DNA-binding beta-propeller fold protein YncE